MQSLPIRRLALVLICSCCVTIASCVSPEILFRLSPVSSDIAWYYGKELVTHQSETMDIGIRFNRQERGYLVFDIEILNLAEEPVLVNPEQFSYIVLQSPADAESLDSTKAPVYAEDAEIIVRRIDSQIASAHASEANAVIGDGVGLLLGVAADIASIGTPKTEEEQEKRRDEARKDRDERNIRNLEYENTVDVLKGERAHWEFDTLRKHTLPSMKSIQGEIYFPVNRKARFLRIRFPIESATTNFVYRQDKILSTGKLQK